MQIKKLHTHTHLLPAQKRMVDPGKDEESKEIIEDRKLIFKRQQNNINKNIT